MSAESFRCQLRSNAKRFKLRSGFFTDVHIFDNIIFYRQPLFIPIFETMDILQAMQKNYRVRFNITRIDIWLSCKKKQFFGSFMFRLSSFPKLIKGDKM